VALRLPRERDARLVPDETRTAVRRPCQALPAGVESVVAAVAPEEIVVRRELERPAELQLDRRVDVDDIGRPDQGRLAELGDTGEERVEATQPAVVRIAIAADGGRRPATSAVSTVTTGRTSAMTPPKRP
jgi:hypothetical protein